MTLSQKNLIIISQKTNGRCFYCNSKEAEEIDHFVSKSKWEEWKLEDTPIKGELNHIKNLFLSCKRCNLNKKDKDPEDFIGNSFVAWNRYDRANKRVLNDFKNIKTEDSFGRFTPSWLLNVIEGNIIVPKELKDGIDLILNNRKSRLKKSGI